MPGELILIVEDNDKNMKLVREVLAFHGYRIAEASTAEEGLEIARTQLPALVLMDIHLPGMDGVTAFKRLRTDPVTEKIPVVAVTASALTSERQTILEAGFDGYQAKPIRLREFVEEVRRVLSSRLDKTKESGDDLLSIFPAERMTQAGFVR